METNDDRLPPPIVCDNCNSSAIAWKQSEARSYWKCSSCGSAVSCHQFSRIPLGRMAPEHTRRLRRKAHESFDRIWRHSLMERDDAYQWLSIQLNIPLDICHLSMLSDHQLEATIGIADNYVTNWHKIQKRRNQKRHDKLAKQLKREIKCRTTRIEDA